MHSKLPNSCLILWVHREFKKTEDDDGGGVELKMTDRDSLTSPNNEYFIALQFEL